MPRQPRQKSFTNIYHIMIRGNEKKAILINVKFQCAKLLCSTDLKMIFQISMNLALLSDGISLESACMVTDMMTTGFYGPELAEVKFGDTVVVFGIGPVGLMAVAGGQIAMLNVLTEIDTIAIPNAAIFGFLSHKIIKGGLCPGGRKRMERLLSMVQAGRVDPSKLITHKFKGLDSIEDAFHLMVNKPKDLIKPIVLID